MIGYFISIKTIYSKIIEIYFIFFYFSSTWIKVVKIEPPFGLSFNEYDELWNLILESGLACGITYERDNLVYLKKIF